ncbi:Zinc-binding family protein [Leishmania donovani]|uniref:Zinc-binding family protein n=1 Tax=Leishmania donovani TaxID=5661 RepID=A0A504XH63_LEIDO|nr:Zinc-binding family protein [Leishmania donovani]
MPADSLEVLNISGCYALLHLRPVRRLSSLRQLKTARLHQLGRLGWWGNAANVDTSLTGRAAGGDSVRDWPVCLEELDLSCMQRRTRPIADFACIGLLAWLLRLSVAAPQEEQSARADTTQTGAEVEAGPGSDSDAENGASGSARAAWSEALTLSDSRLLKDIRALGALPRLQHRRWHAPFSKLMTAVRSATAAVVGWLARASPSPSPLRSPSGASSDAHLACCIEVASPHAASMQQSRMSDTPCSLARLHSTLRYLNALGGKALVDGSAIGSLEHLEHPHAPFTSMRGATLEEELQQCLPELELLSSRPREMKKAQSAGVKHTSEDMKKHEQSKNAIQCKVCLQGFPRTVRRPELEQHFEKHAKIGKCFEEVFPDFTE